MWGSVFDRMGYALSILQYKNIWIGALISSILQFIFYSKFLFERFKNNFPIYKSLIIILLSFSWSHLLSSLNIVRQGIAVNIFIVLFLFPNKKIIDLSYLIFGLFLHKISPVLLFIKQLKNLKILRSKNLKLASVIIVSSLIISYIKITKGSLYNPVGMDLKYIVVLITILHSLLIFIKRKIIPENIKLLTLFLSSIILSFIIVNATQVAERLFLNYLQFILLSFLYLFKNDWNFRVIYIVLLSSYVIISWTIGPLQYALY